MLRKITSCCSTVSEWPHRSCHLPYKVENIDRTPNISSNLQSDYYCFQLVVLLPSPCLPVVCVGNLCFLYSSGSVHKVSWLLYVRYRVVLFAVSCTGRRRVKWNSWQRGVVVSGVRRMNEVNARRARLVYTWMGDCLRAGIPSRYVTSQLGQLSLASLRGRLIEYQLRLG